MAASATTSDILTSAVSSSLQAPTSPLPQVSATSAPDGHSKVVSIAAGAGGGLVALVTVAVGALTLLRRKKKRMSGTGDLRRISDNKEVVGVSDHKEAADVPVNKKLAEVPACERAVEAPIQERVEAPRSSTVNLRANVVDLTDPSVIYELHGDAEIWQQQDET